MAIKNIIAKGIGFSPGTSKWIVTHGFGATGLVAVNTPIHYLPLRSPGRLRVLDAYGENSKDFKPIKGSTTDVML